MLHRLCWLALIQLFSVHISYADVPIIEIDKTSRQVQGKGAIRYFEDPDHNMSFEEISQLSSTLWKTSEKNSPSLGITKNVVWFSVKIRNVGNHADFILLSDYTALDYIEMFLVDSASGERLNHYQTGDHTPFATRPIAHTAFAFPFSLHARQDATVYLRVTSGGNIVVPISVWERSLFFQHQKNFYSVFAFIAGVMGITGIYNLFIYLRTRETLFLSFSLFAVATVFLFTSQSGFGFQFLWPAWTGWNEKVVIWSVAISAAAHLWFSTIFLSLGQLLRKIYCSLMALFLTIALLSPFLPYSLLLKVLLLSAMLCCLLTLVVGIFLWWRGSASARIYSLAWSAFIVGSFTSASIRFGFVPYSFLTEFAGIFGALTTVVVLSIAVADIINAEKQSRIKASQQAISNLQKYQSLYQNSVEGIFVSSVSGQLIRANPALVSMLGYDSEHHLLTSLNYDAERAYKDAAQRDRLIAEVLEKSQLIDQEAELLKQDGTSFWASLSMRVSTGDDMSEPVIEGAIIDISERRQATRELAYLACHDPLTNLFNRREFESQLRKALQCVKTNCAYFCVLYMDLDQFKIVNDTCGHSAGDILLRQLAQLLKKTIQDRALVARLGGDEFGVLIPGLKAEAAYMLAEELRKAIQKYRFVYNSRIFNLGVSIGLIEVSSTNDSIETVMSLADTACYAAKDAGRNRIHIYSASNEELQKRRAEMQLISELNEALENNSFTLLRQAIAATDLQEQTTSYEILIRMTTQQNNAHLTSPNQFLPAAERYNLMPLIDRWVITHCFQWLNQHSSQLAELEHFSINLSGQTLNDEDFIGFLFKSFAQFKIPHHLICFEITESIAIHNLANTLNFIESFRVLGCKFSLDDFGSGFSSYGYLKSLPVDYLKIDGTFITNIAHDSVDFAMVKSINDVAKAMGMKTIAEFVEDQRSIDKLREIGVDYLQGYGIAKPLPLNDLIHFKAETASMGKND